MGTHYPILTFTTGEWMDHKFMDPYLDGRAHSGGVGRYIGTAVTKPIQELQGPTPRSTLGSLPLLFFTSQ